MWGRATPQVRRPVYIGLAMGFALATLVVLGLSNTESFFAMPSELEGIATSQAIWGLKPSNLMMVLPLGAFLVVLARSFIGLKAFGLFTPMLIALAFLQIGPVMGPVVLISSILVGMILAPSLLKLRMTRVGFLGVLISLIVLTLVALQMILDRELQVDAFPVVVCALVVERWWRQWEKDGPVEAASIAFSTVMIAIVIQFVMVSHFALMLIDASPLLMPAGTAVAIAILGRYRGLRLSELHRFAPIWLERRRHARRQELAEETHTNEPAPETEEQTAKERGPPGGKVWAIGSVDDIRFPRTQQKSNGQTPDESQIAARIGVSEDLLVRQESWVVRKAEDVEPVRERRRPDRGDPRD